MRDKLTLPGSLGLWLNQNKKKIKYRQKKLAIFSRGWIKIRNASRRQAARHRAVHWPAILCHNLTKIRIILALNRLANIGRYWHCRPAVLGRGWTKIKNTGGRQTGQHRLVHWPAHFEPWLDWPRSEILAGDRQANTDRYTGQST